MANDNAKRLNIGHVLKRPCHYCQGAITLVTGFDIYPHRQDLWDLPFWRCAGCYAYSGCHKGTTHAKARVANKTTRDLRREAHAFIDPIWQGGYRTRKWVYEQLRQVTGTSKKEAHIGWLSDEKLHVAIDWGTKTYADLMAEAFNNLL